MLLLILFLLLLLLLLLLLAAGYRRPPDHLCALINSRHCDVTFKLLQAAPPFIIHPRSLLTPSSRPLSLLTFFPFQPNFFHPLSLLTPSSNPLLNFFPGVVTLCNLDCGQHNSVDIVLGLTIINRLDFEKIKFACCIIVESNH